MIRKNYLKVNIILFIMIPFLLFALSYINARNIAEKQMLIIGVHDEVSFQSVKKQLYPISSQEDRKSLWSHEHYPLPERAGLDYNVTDIDCIKVKGFSHFAFNVNYEIYNVYYDNQYWTALPMQCSICVNSGSVYEMSNKY